MYNNKLAVALKSADGKVLREFGDTVYVPFGSEYSILLKNLDTSRRALVSVYIDGADISDSLKFIVYPKTSLDLERFVKSSEKGNRFKFIERTSAVAKHRGVDVEDGLIRVEFQFETEANVNGYWKDVYNRIDTPWFDNERGIGFGNNETKSFKGPTSQSDNPGSIQISSNNPLSGTTMDSFSAEVPRSATRKLSSIPQNETGVTAPGSVSEQKFNEVRAFPVDTTVHNMIIKILGETEDNKEVREPITVKTKIECVSCGKKNKAKAKFCSECGTSLQIVA